MRVVGTKLWVAVAAVAIVAGAGPAADANPRVKKKIKKKMTVAMENYDLFSFEDAKRELNEALILAKKAGIEDDPLIAQVHVRLGVVYFAGLNDTESAKVSFINAVSVDPAVEIDTLYRRDDMDQLLEDARAEIGDAGGDDGGGDDSGVDCGEVAGIKHTLIDEAQGGADRPVDAYVGADVDAARVKLHFRPKGVEDFEDVTMDKVGDCRYVGKLPGGKLRGEFVHYYITAYDPEGKVLATKGSSGSPNIISIIGGAAIGPGDDEDPLGTREKRKPVRPSTPSKPTVFLAVALGSGGGYVTGETEKELEPVSCCFAPALFHLFPELGYYLAPNIALSFAFRMGFPVGADVEGAATAAPSGVLRLRYGLSESGDGLQVTGSLGGGIVRHTVAINGEAPEDDVTDTTATGPLLVGAGLGYVGKLGGPLSIAAELNALAGVPIIGELGDCADMNIGGCVRTNFAVQFDVNVGVLFSF